MLLLLGIPYAPAACSIDARTLTLGVGNGGLSNDAGSGGRRPSFAGGAGATIAGAHSGGSNAGGDLGQTEQGGAADDGGAPAVLNGCVDLDQNGTPDCTETLLENSTFDTDVSHWAAESDATLAWDAVDLRGLQNSGSALVGSSKVFDAPGNSLVAADQCVAVQPDTVLSVFADARLEDNTIVGKASISLWFFSEPDCPGDQASDFYQTPEAFDTGSTLILSGAKAVPEGMRSVRVRLGVTKPFRATTFSVRFDNVLVVAR
ncbi:MAG TPA: hypothetical protein VGC79_26210 [Polyangiaceae bacterium]